jgi:hypothetical protein
VLNVANRNESFRRLPVRKHQKNFVFNQQLCGKRQLAVHCDEKKPGCATLSKQFLWNDFPPEKLAGKNLPLFFSKDLLTI